MDEDRTHWHHIHWEHTIAAVVIGAKCEDYENCDRSHIAIQPARRRDIDE